MAASQLLPASLLPHSPTTGDQLSGTRNPAGGCPVDREGIRFTLLFEQVVMSLIREMPVNAVARHVEVTDKRLWRIVHHYASKAIAALDLRSAWTRPLPSAATTTLPSSSTWIDPTSPCLCDSRQGQGMPSEILRAHQSPWGRPEIVEVVCDMSPAFLSAVEQEFKSTSVTVDWFHVPCRTALHQGRR